jgi:hypothetical protein
MKTWMATSKQSVSNGIRMEGNFDVSLSEKVIRIRFQRLKIVRCFTWISAQINNHKSQNLISTDLGICGVLAYGKYLSGFH